MFLSKSKYGTWYLFYEGDDGKTKSITTKCRLKSDALKFLQSFKIDQKKKPKSPFLSSFTTSFLSYAKVNYSAGTQWIYKNVLNRLCVIIGDLPIDKVTALHWDQYKTNRLTSVSPLRTNIELRSLRAAFNTALRWGMMSSNPFAKQALCAVSERAPVFFTREDFQKLIDMIKEPWLREMIIFATLTGLRRAELTNIRWADIDFPQKMLTIQSGPTFRTKHGSKRVIPLSETAMYILQQKKRIAVSEFVFTLNGKQVKGEWLSHKFKFYVYECKFKQDKLHFHSLRHTFASWLVQDGVSLYEVQKLLGHSDAKTTMIYTHLQPEQLHDTVNKILITMN